MSQAAERLIINDQTKQDIIVDEHLVRYRLASQLVQDKIVLDVACGSGYGAKLLAEAGARHVIAVDIDPETIKQASQQYADDKIKYLVDSAETLEQLADNSVDLIVSFETIEHLQDYKKYLVSLSRVLNEHGIVMISTPNKDAFGEVDNHYHLKEFTKEEFTSELKRVFMEVKLFDQHNTLASLIQADDNKITLDQSAVQRVLYFIAICSQQPLTVELKSVVSFNQQALENWYNNPALKVSNIIYKLLVKLGIKR